MKSQEVDEVAVGLTALPDPKDAGQDEGGNPDRNKTHIERTRYEVQDGNDKEECENVGHFKAENFQFFLKALIDFADTKTHWAGFSFLCFKKTKGADETPAPSDVRCG
jgi:hypothetical protein